MVGGNLVVYRDGVLNINYVVLQMLVERAKNRDIMVMRFWSKGLLVLLALILNLSVAHAAERSCAVVSARWLL